MASFMFRSDQRYKIEIKLGLYQCLVSNATIAKQMQGFGFHDVSVSGSGRNRVAQGAWLQDDATVTVKMIPDKIDMNGPGFALAELLGGIGKAEELHGPGFGLVIAVWSRKAAESAA